MEVTMLIGGDAVNIRTFGPKKDRPLRYVGSNYVWIKPGGAFVVGVDGYPTIIAKASSLMIVGHDESADIVDKIVGAFRARGAPTNWIDMCVQFATQDLESTFMERACEVGLRYVWATSSLECPVPARAHEYVVIRRRGCYH